MMSVSLLILAQNNLPFGALQFISVEVESVLQDLDVNKSSGPDEIPPIILKNCASAFAKPLSFATSVFPDRWKVSSVTPIQGPTIAY
jgi:hypothetical protein